MRKPVPGPSLQSILFNSNALHVFNAFPLDQYGHFVPINLHCHVINVWQFRYTIIESNITQGSYKFMYLFLLNLLQVFQ